MRSFYRMLFVQFAVLAFAGAVVLPGCAQDADPKASTGDVVCTVDGTPVKVQELQDAIDDMIKQAGQRQQLPAALLPQLKSQLYGRALDSLIDKVLLANIAKTKKITVTDQDIETRIADLRKKFPSEEKFNQILAQNGLTLDSLKQEMKSDYLYVKVLDTEVKKSDAPTEDEIKKFFEEKKEQMGEPEQVRASHILLTVDEKATPEEKAKQKAKLEGIRKDILDKKITFEDAAKANSDCPSKAKGGDLDYFGKDQMVPAFSDVAFKTKVGEISDIVETQFGYHIIKVTDHKDAHEPTLAEMHDKISDYLVQTKDQSARQDYLKKLRETAKIETLIDQETWQKRNAPAPEAAPDNGKDMQIQLDPNQLKP